MLDVGHEKHPALPAYALTAGLEIKVEILI
jgi:hypothetical protein